MLSLALVDFPTLLGSWVEHLLSFSDTLQVVASVLSIGLACIALYQFFRRRRYAKLKGNKQHAKSLCQRGEVALRGRKFQDALALFGEAYNRTPNSYWALRGRGQAYLALKQPGRALEDFNVWAKLQPEGADAHYHRALALMRMGLNAESLRACQRALSHSPSNGRALELSRQLDPRPVFGTKYRDFTKVIADALTQPPEVPPPPSASRPSQSPLI